MAETPRLQIHWDLQLTIFLTVVESELESGQAVSAHNWTFSQSSCYSE